MRASKEGSSQWQDVSCRDRRHFFSWETTNLSRTQVDNCLSELKAAQRMGSIDRRGL